MAVLASTVLPGCSNSHLVAARPRSTSGYHDDADDADDARPGSAARGPLQSALRCAAMQALRVLLVVLD